MSRKTLVLFAGILFFIVLCLAGVVFIQKKVLDATQQKNSPTVTSSVPAVFVSSTNELEVTWNGSAVVVPTTSLYNAWTRALCTETKWKEFGAEDCPAGRSGVQIISLGTIVRPAQFAGRELLLLNIPTFSPATDIVVAIPDPASDSFILVDVVDKETSQPSPLAITDMPACPSDTYVDSAPIARCFLFKKQTHLVVALGQLPQSLDHPDQTGALTSIGMLTKDFWGAPLHLGEYGSEVPVLKKTTQPAFSVGGYDVYLYKNMYVIQRPDGGTGLYRFDPYFLKSTGGENKDSYAVTFTADIVWKDGKDRSKQVYQPGVNFNFSGCGSLAPPTGDLIDTTDPTYEWFHEKDLASIGKTKRGEEIYGFKSPEHNPHVQYLYYGTHGLSGDGATPEGAGVSDVFNAFSKADQKGILALAHEPAMFFWKDGEGRWRGYVDASLQSMAECGKPVVYLYPEKTTTVNVQEFPNGGFTKTVPTYEKNGWTVRAEPNGTLISLSDKKTYPYLFWEGHADGFSFSDKGFVFARADVATKMKEILGSLGLNTAETNDFLEFWLPKMIKKPFVFVTFAGGDYASAVPLQITPKPDTTIRVMMSFTPLDTSKKVEPLYLSPPARKGFTVVEWGGVLR